MSNHGATALPQLFYGGSWVSIPSDVLEGDGVEVSRGYADEGALKPARITWRMNNVSDNYRPSNPSSPLYVNAARNMPAAMAIDGSIRATCEASSWKPDQTAGFTVGPPVRGLRWVDLVAEGILRRIGSWNDPIRSAMRRMVPRFSNLRGYWPLEDPSAATQLTNVYPGGLPGQMSGVTLQGGAGPAGSDQVAAITATSFMSGRFQPGSDTGGWQFCFAIRLPALPSATLMPMMQWQLTNGYQYEISSNSTTYRILVTSGTTTLKDVSYSFGTGAEPNQWIQWRIKATQAAGTVTVETAWYPQDGTLLFGVTDTFAGSIGALRAWKQDGNSNITGGFVGHVFGVQLGTDNLLSSTVINAFNGYKGELAADRFTRLCAELSIPTQVIGTAGKSWPMGRQASDVFLELLKEIQQTDGCLIYDSRTEVGLTIYLRDQLYNQTAALALTYPGHVAPPLQEIIDDQGSYNRVTVRQRNGSEITDALLTGPMSVAQIGEYKRTIDVNISSEKDLGTHADWWTARGTIEGARYNRITVDLDANPGLLAQVNAVEIGNRITMTGRTPDPVGLIVIGIEDVMRNYRRLVTFNCLPDNIFTVGIYDNTGSRYDSATSTLAAGATNTATSFSITTADKLDVWSTAAGYQWLVAGERVTVTAMTSAAGTGPYTQTATVTRSVNAIVKAQLSGAVVQLADPVRYAL